MDKLLKIKGLLAEKKITQQEFANKIGISKPTLTNIFAGRSKIDVDMIEVIAEVLSVPVSYFFEGGDVPGKRKEDTNNDALERLIKEKDERIKELKEMIEILRNKGK